jgi:hypothetical protein
MTDDLPADPSSNPALMACLGGQLRHTAGFADARGLQRLLLDT